MKKTILLTTAMLCSVLTITAQNTENGYQWVDLGLPSGLKWATMNVGATAPEEYGDYFAWGETVPKDNYNWNTYKWGTAAEAGYWKLETLTKYNGTDGKTTFDPEDDAATVNWGGRWRMPTDAEWTELRDNCIWTWTTLNGVNGCKVKSNTNGNFIFLPAAGFCIDDYLLLAGDNDLYWSGSLDSGSPDGALFVLFNSNFVLRNLNYRCCGLSVRPVFK